MTEESVKYETKTVRSIRGMESRTAAKWEKEGWEVVSQSQGNLQTEIVLRRPKAKPPWGLIAIGGGLLAVAIITPITIGALSDSDSAEPAATATARDIEPTPAEPAPTSQAPTPAVPEQTRDEVLTAENNADLAAILELSDYCDSSIAEFAVKYRDATIAFDGNVSNMAKFDGTNTRYNLLLGVGDYSETSSIGPAFQFRDVNTTYDLHYTGETPDAINVGTSLHITADVGEYEPNSCLFLLEPVETAIH
ncbi:DUF4839 domain-containing protein [Georgenia sp. Marseille-Q6866]